MLDTNKIKFLKILAGIVGVILIFLIGFGFGSMGKSTSSTTTETKSETTTTETAEEDTLTAEEVQKFLMVYYTKKDLEENRNRYKEYMTDAMYNQQVALEEDPTTQTYKGYVVDFEYQDSDVYLDTVDNIALVKVTYQDTLLAKKNDYSQARTMTETATLRITYSKTSDGFLVNNIESIILVDAENSDEYAEVNTLETGETTTSDTEVPTNDTASSTEESN